MCIIEKSGAENDSAISFAGKFTEGNAPNAVFTGCRYVWTVQISSKRELLWIHLHPAVPSVIECIVVNINERKSGTYRTKSVKSDC